MRIQIMRLVALYAGFGAYCGNLRLRSEEYGLSPGRRPANNLVTQPDGKWGLTSQESYIECPFYSLYPGSFVTLLL